MPTVIKAHQAGEMVGRLCTVDLADHLREAEAVIAAARLKAAELVRDARRDAARLVENAHSEGLRTGFAEGMAEGRTRGYAEARAEAHAAFQEQQGALVRTLLAAVESFGRMKSDLEIAARRDVLEFAVASSRRLTFTIGGLYREAAQENLRRALDLVAARTNLTVQLNPADHQAVAEYSPALLERLGCGPAVKWEAVASIAPGGCRVEAPPTEIDATLETQTDELVRLLLCPPQPTPAEVPHV